MKITVEFENLEEFDAFRGGRPFPDPLVWKEVPAPAGPVTIADPFEPKEVQQEVPAPEPREDAAHVSGMCPVTAQEPEPEIPWKEEKPEEPVKKEGPAKSDAPRIEDVRKALAELNKAAGKNVAKDLIKEIGYKKLTEVPPEKLPELQALAEEKGKAYA